VKARPRRPGLAKAGAQRFVLSRQQEVWQSVDYRWRELFEKADVMSEGAVRRDADGPIYYGTTSVLLPYVSAGGLVPDEFATSVTRLAARDPHARVRAIRIACREAQVRSKDPIGKVRAEFVVRPDSRGVRIDIDVEAPVHESPARSAPSGEKRRAERAGTGVKPKRVARG
jgi:hypothetical protein